MTTKQERMRILKLINQLIKTRKKSIQYRVNSYEEIFSINDLRRLKILINFEAIKERKIRK